MKRSFIAFFAILLGLAIIGCGCSNDEGNTSINQNLYLRYEVFKLEDPNSIPYRIPALAVTKDGTLIAVSDYRHSGTDIGVTDFGRIDLHYSLSYDNGKTWTEVKSLIDGKGAEAKDFMSVGYGDPCIVADRESNRVLMLSCAGNVSFQKGTRQNHQNIARFYSEDGGKTWSAPEDIAESIYSQFDDSYYGPVRSMFVASGRIFQSRSVKVGSYYRLYCAVLVRDRSDKRMNYVLYSDDFGGRWTVLGDIDTPAVYNTADEPKVEELPDGSILISSRYDGGRYYNIFTFTNAELAQGSWDKAVFSGAENGGVEAKQNSTNGEVMVLPVTRVEDNEPMHLLLQSLPLGPDRKNVGIYYKELASMDDYIEVENLASNWDGVKQVTTLNSAYSTMAWQKNNCLGFLYEEETYGKSNYAYGGYTIVYERFTIENITDNKYKYRKE
ncbi:MAG: exo-alpha-sialidase [Alistipes sp.]|nr:exo-alpha-sialidase [Alistipes sp.]